MGTLTASDRTTMARSESASRRRRLRITHIVSSLNVGGMEHFVVRIAEAQARLGHSTTILALKDGPLSQAARDLGIRVEVLGGQKVQRVARALFKFAVHRPQIVHAHNSTSLHYAELAKRSTGARIVYTNHGQGREPGRIAQSHELARVDAAVAVSAAVADRLAAPELEGKVSVIQNGVTTFEPLRTREHVRAELGLADEFVGVIVARIDGLKGHQTLLEAAADIKARGIAATLLIAGDGKERDNMEALAQNLGLGRAQVRFLGFRSDIVNLLGAADFFVLPSLTEGLPLSMLEAMAQRTPVIATPVGGIPEVITDGVNGLLVPVEDPKRLADAIARLANSRDERATLAESAFALIQSEYSFGRMIERYESLYRSVLD